MNGKRILAATDFTEQSLAALEYAVYIANRLNARIDLVYVAEKKIVREKVEDKIAYKSKLENIYQQLEQVKIKSGAAFRISDHVIFSDKSFYEEIIDYGTEHAFDLCCLGVSSSAKHTLGDNTEQLVKTADFPILTCREVKRPIQFKNLLLPIDLTIYTNEKVDRIIQFAKQFDAVIHLLAVSEFFEELINNASVLNEKMEHAAQQIRNEGLKCVTEIIKNDYVNNSILEYAEEIDAELLVIMSKQENRILELFLGSRVNKVIGQSKIPVLSFRPEEDD
ncbi:MAG: universal stress protein [Fimbriimonadaceae bacterium]|nr:universal stress protein [Chitinophagales bacterium]